MQSSHMSALRIFVGLWCFVSIALGAIYAYDVPVFIVLPIAIAISAYVGWQWWRASQNNEGVLLLRSGRTIAGLKKFEAADANGHSATFAFNIALAELYLLRLDRSKAAFDRARRRGIPTHLRLSYEANYALCCALSESSPAALPAKLVAREDPDALLAQAVTLARTGAWASAEQVLLRRELKQLGGFARALSEAVAALAAWHLRGERHHVDRTMLFGEVGDEGLAQGWPELAEFLRDPENQQR